MQHGTYSNVGPSLWRRSARNEETEAHSCSRKDAFRNFWCRNSCKASSAAQNPTSIEEPPIVKTGRHSKVSVLFRVGVSCLAGPYCTINTTVIPYTMVCITHPSGGFFQARLLDHEGGANTERNVFGKLSERLFQRRYFWHRVYLNCRDIENRKSAQGGVIHRRTRYY